MKRSVKPCGYVYLAVSVDGTVFKIGHTRKLNRRFHSLGFSATAALGREIRAMHYLWIRAGGRKAETEAIHRALGVCTPTSGREWFQPSVEIFDAFVDAGGLHPSELQNFCDHGAYLPRLHWLSFVRHNTARMV